MQITGNVSSVLEQKSAAVHTIRPDATVFEAIQSMSDRNVGALLVVDGEKFLGVVSERDYTRKVAVKGKSSRTTLVSEIVSEPVIAVAPDERVEECMRLMTQHRVRHLPVLDGSRIAGVVSIGDLVNWTISAQSATIDQLETYIFGGQAAM